MLAGGSIIASRAFTWTTYTIVAGLLFPAALIRLMHFRSPRAEGHP
jgi:hypothetical protein